MTRATSKFRKLLVSAGCAILAAPALAGLGASGCDDLSDIAATPGIGFQSQIQPVLDNCTSCHGESGQADLDLRPGESYDNIVGVISMTNPSRLRVDPFNPDASALFLAVACDSPNGPAFRMPGTTREDRALIRDWIAQGAFAEPAAPPEPVTVPVNAPWTLVALILLLLIFTGIRFQARVST